ncbi:hypothetical protein [uncultured Pleomorphomonas sp.]|nr:hypothetical protein [uncultured Pleomorphomonas sp.]
MSDKPETICVGLSLEPPPAAFKLVVSRQMIGAIARAFGVSEEAAKRMIDPAIIAVKEPISFRDLYVRPSGKDISGPPEIPLDLPLKKARNLRDATPWTHKRQPWQAHRSKRGKR